MRQTATRSRGRSGADKQSPLESVLKVGATAEGTRGGAGCLPSWPG